MKLKGMVAIVTSAGSGIGTAVARRFTEDGIKTVMNDVNEENLKATAGALPKESVITCAGDVTKIDRLRDNERYYYNTLRRLNLP